VVFAPDLLAKAKSQFGFYSTKKEIYTFLTDSENKNLRLNRVRKANFKQSSNMNTPDNFPQLPLKDQLAWLGKLFLLILFAYIIKAL
jgi:hypothetical protein